MKAYKVEVLVLDFENYGPEQIELMLGNVRGLYCSVESIAEAEIGKWTDEHPLNHGETSKAEYQRLFAAPAIAAPVEVERDAALQQAKNTLRRFLNYGRIFLYRRHDTDPFDDAEQAIAAIDAAIATGDKHE